MHQTYHGGCHCGRVTFELQAHIDHVVECNCSVCHMHGALWHGASEDALRIVSGRDDLALYQFGTMTAQHYFCRHCGTRPLSRPRFDPRIWVVNARCIAGLDLAALPVVPFDGRNYEAAATALLARRRPGPAAA